MKKTIYMYTCIPSSEYYGRGTLNAQFAAVEGVTLAIGRVGEGPPVNHLCYTRIDSIARVCLLLHLISHTNLLTNFCVTSCLNVVVDKIRVYLVFVQFSMHRFFVWCIRSSGPLHCDHCSTPRGYKSGGWLRKLWLGGNKVSCKRASARLRAAIYRCGLIPARHENHRFLSQTLYTVPLSIRNLLFARPALLTC